MSLIENNMSSYYLSKCCNAQVSEVGIDEFTCKYECHKCGEQGCDIYPEARSQRRQERINRSLFWLRERGIELTLLNEANAHYRFDIFDYWPTTQVFMNRATKKLGKGLGPFYDNFRKHYKLQYGTEWVVPPVMNEINGTDWVPYITPKLG